MDSALRWYNPQYFFYKIRNENIPYNEEKIRRMKAMRNTKANRNYEKKWNLIHQAYEAKRQREMKEYWKKNAGKLIGLALCWAVLIGIVVAL